MHPVRGGPQVLRRIALQRAESWGVGYQELKGNMTLPERLINGPWDDDLQVIRSGEAVRPAYDDAIVGTGTAAK